MVTYSGARKIRYFLVLILLAACHDGSSGRGDQVAAVAPEPTPAAEAPGGELPIEDQTYGLTLLDEQQLSERLLELSFETQALSAPTRLRILLPADYATTDKRYPVLLLLHGALDDYRSWSDKGDAEAATEELPLIVVMPDGGQNGFYSDWYNNGAGGSPQWEQFHLFQLLPWIDAHFRTVGKRNGRAIAGLSMGGFGALSYAARHPDLFVAAASFSGVVDSNLGPLAEAARGEDETTTSAIWGHRALQEVRWRGHNPWDLAANLRELQLTLRTGNGLPGGPFGGGDPIETLCWLMSTSVHDRLDELGIEHVWDDYGAGGHDWPYWQRSLRDTLPDLMTALAQPLVPVTDFSHTTIEPDYSVYGWRVQLQRAVLEFSHLENVSAKGFSLSGSGSALITTAAEYVAHGVYVVAATGPYEWNSRQISADPDGRLRIPLTLGPDNPRQQYSPGAQASDTKVYRVSVSITSAQE